jgi:hypothetical protein
MQQMGKKFLVLVCVNMRENFLVCKNVKVKSISWSPSVSMQENLLVPVCVNAEETLGQSIEEKECS